MIRILVLAVAVLLFACNFASAGIFAKRQAAPSCQQSATASAPCQAAEIAAAKPAQTATLPAATSSTACGASGTAAVSRSGRILGRVFGRARGCGG